MKISSHQYGIAYRHRNCGNTTIYIRSESFHLDQITTNVPDLLTVNMLLPSARQGLCPGRKCNNRTSRTQKNESLCLGEVCHRRCKYTTFFENECKNSGKVCLLPFCKPLAGTGTLESQSPRFSFSQMLPRCELNLGCTALCASHHAITLQKYNKYSEYFGPIWSFFIWRTKKGIILLKNYPYG